MTKDEVRSRAAELGLRTADKPDSQDVCFITSTSRREGFLKKRIPLTPGRVVDTDGDEVGRVDAVELLTIGQRRGLDLSGGAGPRYVVSTDVRSATVTVGSRRDLSVSETSVSDLAWSDEPAWGPVEVQCPRAPRRRRGDLIPGSEERSTVVWDSDHERVAPGQAVVFYRGDRVLGSGTAC